MFQTAQTPLLRGQRKQAKPKGGIYCPKTYIWTDSDSLSLTSADGSSVYLEVCTSFLCSWGRRVQQKPAHACMNPATAGDKLCPAWHCGGSPGTGCESSVTRPSSITTTAFVCHHCFPPEWKWEVCGFACLFCIL